MNDKHKYYAFISYKREDEEWAAWLQHEFEHYRLPSTLNGHPAKILLLDPKRHTIDLQ